MPYFMAFRPLAATGVPSPRYLFVRPTASRRSVCSDSAARMPSTVSGMTTASCGMLMANMNSRPLLAMVSSKTAMSYMSARLWPRSRA